MIVTKNKIQSKQKAGRELARKYKSRGRVPTSFEENEYRCWQEMQINSSTEEFEEEKWQRALHLQTMW